jgi:hypothetical protein
MDVFGGRSLAELGGGRSWAFLAELRSPSSDHHRQNLRVHSLGFSSTKHGILLYSTDTD